MRAVERVCSILDRLQESAEGVSLIDVGRATGLPKSSAFRYLWTLEAHRYVERDGRTGLYRLGFGLVGMQSRTLEVLRERARPLLEALRDEFGETSTLGLLDGDRVLCVASAESGNRVRLADASGDRDPVHSTALGKAIAAQLPETRVREILSRAGMHRQAPNTITTVEAYVAELAKVRRSGYAIEDGENASDGRCVAVPLPGTRLPAALGIGAPSARFTFGDVERAATVLADVAGRLATSPEGQYEAV